MKDNGSEPQTTVFQRTKRERAGGSVNAAHRPLCYCEAATAVAPGPSWEQSFTHLKGSKTSTGGGKISFY